MEPVGHVHGEMEQIECRSLDEAATVFQSAAYRQRAQLEGLVAALHQHEKAFHVPGICLVDAAPVAFLVDRHWGALRLENGTWLPNWRERLECPVCGLNNRQRAMATVVMKEFARRRLSNESASIYLMEQITATYRVLAARLPRGSCIGSEYFGPERAGGEVIGGIRHENAQQLSFASASLDMIVSNDVFEHVPRPDLAVREAARVLRPGGTMFFTIPFHSDRIRTKARAELVDGHVTHHVAAEYHGDPLTGGASLVYTDFGWDFLDEVRSQGFADCTAVAYWSLEYGHLGTNNLLFVARR